MSATAGPARRAGTIELIGVAAVVLAGTAARFWAPSPLWLDEALTVNIAELLLGDIPGALERDGLPPLYYALLSGWIDLFGSGDTAVRALAGVLSVASLPVMYLAGRRLGGARVGLVAVTLLALNPYAIRYATEARMYALIMLLVLVGYLLVDAGLARPRLLTLAGIALVTGALAYSHYWTFWLIGATAVVVGWRAVRGGAGRPAAWRVLGALAVGGVLFLPWLPTFLEQAAHTATPWAPPSRPTQVLATSLVDFGGGDVAEAIVLGFALGVLFLLGVFARSGDGTGLELDLRTVAETRGVAGVAVGSLVLGTLAGLATGSGFAGRYAAIAFPLFVLVAAVGVARLPASAAQWGVLAVVVLLGGAVTADNARTDRTQAGEIAAAIEAGDPDGADLGAPVVVYCPDQLGPAVERLLPDGRYDQVVFPELDLPAVDSPRRIDWYDYADRQAARDPAEVAAEIDARAGPANAIWVVFNPTYRTVDERCVELLDELGRLRTGRPVVVADPTEHFEHAGLQLYLPRS